MALFQSAPTSTVTLPVTGITCVLQVSWGTKKRIEELWTRDLELEVGSDARGGKVKASLLAEQDRMSLELCVKSWDAEDENGAPVPLTVENMEQLPPEDGEALKDAITALLSKKNSKEIKKG